MTPDSGSPYTYPRTPQMSYQPGSEAHTRNTAAVPSHCGLLPEYRTHRALSRVTEKSIVVVESTQPDHDDQASQSVMIYKSPSGLPCDDDNLRLGASGVAENTPGGESTAFQSAQRPVDIYDATNSRGPERHPLEGTSDAPCHETLLDAKDQGGDREVQPGEMTICCT
jgi:hypothetical protein